MKSQPAFQRDPLNWEGRAREEWRHAAPVIAAPFYLVESEPGYVQMSTDVLRGLLTEAGYSKAGDL